MAWYAGQVPLTRATNRARLAAEILAAVALAACAPLCLPATYCASPDECPDGYTCNAHGYCVRPANAGADASAGADGGADAAVDAGRDAGACPSRYRREVVVDGDQVSAQLRHFPLLVAIASDTRLKEHALTDGADLWFSAADGFTRLPHEIEDFQKGSGSLVAWVQVPLLDPGVDEVLYLYCCGDAVEPAVPAEVWDDNYVGVWHLDDPISGSRQVPDSTRYANHGTASAAMQSSDRVEGWIGAAYDFRDSDCYIDLGNSQSLQITGELTVEAWFNADRTGNWYLLSKSGGDYNRGWDISFDDGAPGELWVMFRYSSDGDDTVYVSSWTEVVFGRWYHAAGVFEPGQAGRFYVDGALDASVTTSHQAMHDANQNVGLGTRLNDPSGFDGKADEVRISNIARSAAWIAAQHRNCNSDARFMSLGEWVQVSSSCGSP